MPRISVIVNNYNYGHLLPEAIESVLAQTTRDMELIVVDDGSTDGSAKFLDRYDGRARIILQENCGQAGAINRGVTESNGDYLCFLDSDDWWAPGKLTAVAAAFDADPAVSLVYHRLQPVDAAGRPILRPIPRALCSGDIAPRLARSAGWWPFPMTSAVAVRRSTWDMAGPIPEEFRISADAWLVGIQPFLGWVKALPRPLGYYRIHSNNWFRAADDPQMLRRRIAHWELTVQLSNAFLAQRREPLLRLEDHLPLQVAAARLTGADPARRLSLALHQLRFAGEPNPLRRLRDALRLWSDLREPALAPQPAASP